MRHGLTRVHHQELKQFKLLWREMNSLTVLLNQVAGRVEPHIAYGYNCRFFIGGFVATDRSAESRDQLAQLEGFGYVIVSACIQRFDFAILAPLHRQHDNGQACKVATKHAAYLNATHAGHVDIEEYNVELCRPCERQRLLTTRRLNDDE